MTGFRPWRFTGSARLGRDESTAQVLDRLAVALSGQGKPNHRDADGMVTFTDRSMANWRTLSLFSRGRVWIEQERDGARLRYELRCLDAFIFCLICSTAIGLFVGFGGRPILGAEYGLAAFAWLYGGNLLTAALRVPRFFRKIARGHASR